MSNCLKKYSKKLINISSSDYLIRYQRIFYGFIGGGLTLFLNILIGSIAVSSSNEKIALLITNLLSIPIIIEISNWGSSGWMRTKKYANYLDTRKINIIEVFLVRFVGILIACLVLCFFSTLYWSNELIRYQLRYICLCIPFAFLWAFSCSHSYALKNSTKYDILIPSLPSIGALLFSLFAICIAINTNKDFENFFQIFSLLGLYIGAIIALVLETTKGNEYNYNIESNLNFLRSRSISKHIQHFKVFFVEGLSYTLMILPGILLSRIVSSILLNVSYDESIRYNLFKSNFAAFSKTLLKTREGLLSKITTIYESAKPYKSFLRIQFSLWKHFVYLIFLPLILFVSTFAEFNFLRLMQKNELYLLFLLIISCLNWFVVSSYLTEWVYTSRLKIRSTYTIITVTLISILLTWLKPNSIDKFLTVEIIGSFLGFFISSMLNFKRKLKELIC